MRYIQGRQQKIFHGVEATKKDRKIAKTTENSTIKSLSGGGANGKTDRK